MKKILAWLGTAALLVGLCGCKPTQKQADKAEAAAPTNDTEYTFTASEDAEPLPGGAAITLITGPEGVEEGADAALWQGISAFAYNFGYVPKNAAAASGSAEDLQAALTQAADSGSKVVVCRGDAMAQIVYTLQDQYPDTYFMVVDAEAHSADYSDYTAKDTVRCVLFSETQAGYLAGYAAVSEGYQTLGFVGAEEMPDTVRYCTGFMQGAEKAAEQQGNQITLRVWYTGTKEYSDAVADRMAYWYNDGTQVIFAADEASLQAVLAGAAQTENDAKAIAARWDHSAQDEAILFSTLHCYNTMVQQELYAFFAAGGQWQQAADTGHTETVGLTENMIALSADTWRLSKFTKKNYNTLYEKLRSGALKTEDYAGMDNLPELENVTVQQ
ncbi:BMP family protein [uncultured Gemmiger sp.]|uniref:BMP family lipoprotein n=1 Tax=uncultured Gemmiger sp. TaxID=1623490 RepID=UPI0025EA86CB|nr:BMP family ABC transporter substrate-binding protein [uncultured Gemmiger sp.]